MIDLLKYEWTQRRVWSKHGWHALCIHVGRKYARFTSTRRLYRNKSVVTLESWCDESGDRVNVLVVDGETQPVNLAGKVFSYLNTLLVN